MSRPVTVFGVVLLGVGAVGTLGSIVFGGLLIGQWAMASAVVFTMAGVAGVLLVGRGQEP
ncbi:hypothetical protein [Rhodococcus sp. NPDC003348]